MSKTLTPRMAQPKWSSGSDSLRRADLNAASDTEEARTAYDDGFTYDTLPGTVIAGRYVMRQPAASSFRSLYRSTGDAGSWEQAVGNAIPAPLSFRPHVAGDQAITDAAATFTHPSLTSPGATITYDGTARVGKLTAFDLNDTDGSVHVGANVAADPPNLGRLHVKTRVDTDRGLVLMPHGAGAGNMLTSREPGGQDVVTIDAAGYLRARSLVGLGGGAINSGAATVAAPTSSSGDGVDIGLLVHGQSTATAKAILSVRRDLADTAPVLHVLRDSMTIGRLDWGNGTTGGGLALAGRQILQRAVGYDADTLLWRLNRADTSTPGNAGLDEVAFSVSRAAALLRTPLVLTQALGTSATVLNLKRYTDFSGRFLELNRVTGAEVNETIGAWEADGRLSVGARWIGTGVRRDARQELKHASARLFSGDYGPGDTQTYEWPTMTSRSVTAFDLHVDVRVEATLGEGLFSDAEDGQQYFLNLDVSINGGAYVFVDSCVMGGPAHRFGARPMEVQTGTFQVYDVAAAATFKFRTRIFIGGAVPRVTIRRIFVTASESLVTNYVAP